VAPGYPLGIEEDEAYAQATTSLAPDDLLVLYTDGVTEARDPSRAFFGPEGLDAAVQAAGTNDPAAVIRGVLDAVEAFTGNRAPDDDRTLLVARVS
jgi:sigma-B regulation protein RsbU (phosphoserine phosphatase)